MFKRELCIGTFQTYILTCRYKITLTVLTDSFCLYQIQFSVKISVFVSCGLEIFKFLACFNSPFAHNFLGFSS